MRIAAKRGTASLLVVNASEYVWAAA